MPEPGTPGTAVDAVRDLTRGQGTQFADHQLALPEPPRHWSAQRADRTLELVDDGRRPAGYEIIDTRENTRRTVALPLVDDIRERVRRWRGDGWPGTTEVTRELLRHWWDEDGQSRRPYRFYFCQLEAAETLIWQLEAAAEYRQGVYVPGDGGPFERLCNKMATGTGKTTVMAMLITWQVLNALTYPKRNRHFARAVLVVAPGLTVKDRLRVLYPGDPDNYYDAFDLAPTESARQRLNRMSLLVENWHTLMPLKDGRALGGEEGRRERRGLHAPGAGAAGAAQGPARHQRRGPPRLPHAGRRQGQQAGRRGPGASTWTRPRAGSRGWTASTTRAASRAAWTCRRRRSPPPGAPIPRPGCSAGW